MRDATRVAKHVELTTSVIDIDLVNVPVGDDILEDAEAFARLGIPTWRLWGLAIPVATTVQLVGQRGGRSRSTCC